MRVREYRRKRVRPIQIPNPIWIGRHVDSFPAGVHRLSRLLIAAGFSQEAYRSQPFAAAARIKDDREAMDHFLSKCAAGSLEYPVRIDPAGLHELACAPVLNKSYLACLISNLINNHIATNPECVYDAAFWNGALSGLRRIGRPYVLIGDSHSRLSRSVGGTVRRPLIPIHVLCSAGSAIGLSNRDSRSGYGRHLQRLAVALADSDDGLQLPIVLQFGQVDIEFVSVFRRIKRRAVKFDHEEFASFKEQVASSYVTFIAATFSRFQHVHIFSIFPPTLSDAAWAEGYVNAHVAQLESLEEVDQVKTQVRNLEIPSLQERSRLHREFNDALDRHCADKRLIYRNVFDVFLGRQSIVKDRFFALSGGLDHHLDEQTARPVIRIIIDRLLKEID